MKASDMVKIGHYAFARELENGEWAIYVGRWSGGKGHVTDLRVQRDAGRPLHFASLNEAKEYAKFRGL